MAYVNTGFITNSLSYRLGMGCIGFGIYFCLQTLINSSAPLMSLMALQLMHVDRRTFRPSRVEE